MIVKITTTSGHILYRKEDMIEIIPETGEIVCGNDQIKNVSRYQIDNGEEVRLISCYLCKWNDGEGGFCKYTNPERYSSCNYDKSGWETKEEEQCVDIE